MADPREIVIALPPGLRLLSLNGREHWAEKNRRSRALKNAAWAMALKARADGAPRMERVTITVEYQPPDRRRRDPDKLTPRQRRRIAHKENRATRRELEREYWASACCDAVSAAP